MSAERILPSSFRDPSGFLFHRDGILYRQVNRSYREDYDLLVGSGLYDRLVEERLLVYHEEITGCEPPAPGAYKLLRPEPVPFVSYPYEWSFSQLKDAALATLRIQKTALAFGMTLKDCSAFNIQFVGTRPLLIDTLSFERYREGEPWVAYRQFCQHFLAPLALVSYVDASLGRLSRLHIDGVPLSLASSLLPFSTRCRFSLLTHIHLHAGGERRFADRPQQVAGRRMGRTAFLALVENLESAVSGLRWRPRGSAWAEYYQASSYSAEALDHKAALVAEFLAAMEPAPRTLWDLGANTGTFSRIASKQGIETVAFDSDPACVEQAYLEARRSGDAHLLPLLVDLTNPSPGLGWSHEERMSLLERGPADAALALALIHHLAIANNVPLAKVAAFLGRLCRWLVIEFVPKDDSQVQRLLASRKDIFADYAQEGFEAEFGRYFTIRRVAPIRGTQRLLYLMQRARQE
ncbi:MAG: SAM-dependent methyltransferase [Anaerolineae bacterium]|nr:SAM-dependent methyltransferase [Anaerolineae bacterium]